MKPLDQAGRFHYERSLGAGGMGEVFLVQDRKLGRRVALKRLHPRSDVAQRRRRRFRQEARAAARISHHAVVRVFELIEEEDTDYIVMEYVDGTTLRARLKDRASLTLGQTFHLGRQIAAGMAAAHALGVIHRDLKTENILITRDGDAKIADFGIAKIIGDDTLTEEGTVIGTCKAMSPEQARGDQIDLRTDLFSFGVLLYECLAGAPPFTGRTSAEILEAINTHEPPPLAERCPTLPAALLNLVGQLLQKSRELRPAGGFNAVARELEELADTLSEEDAAPIFPNAADHDETRSVESSGPIAEFSPAADPTGPVAPVAELDPRQPSANPREHRADATQSSRPYLRTGGAALLLAALVYLAWLLAASHPSQPSQAASLASESAPKPLYIAVDEPKRSQCEDVDDGHLRAVRGEIQNALISMEGIRVLFASSVDDVQGTPYELVPLYGRLFVQLTCYPDRLLIEIELRDPKLYGSPIRPQQHISILYSDVDRTKIPIRKMIDGLIPEGGARRGGFPFSVHPDDVDRYLDLRRQYWQNDPDILTEQIIAELGDIRARSSGLIDAYRFEAELWHHQYVKSGEEGDYLRAWYLLAVARMLEPDSHLVLSGIIALALDHGDLDVADEALEALRVRTGSGSGLTLYLDALIKLERSELEAARDLLQKAARSRPSWRIRYYLAVTEMRLGNPDKARKHVDELLKLSPENRAGLRLRETAGCKSPIDPSDLQQANRCATKLMMQGRYADAAHLLRRTRTHYPDHVGTAFNLGEALKLAGEREEARSRFQDVLELIDQDTQAPEQLSLRALALAHLERPGPARRAIEQAVKLSPEDVDRRYEAAATYALLGDREATVRFILATPVQSYGPQWFDFPWFDLVRADPRLRERLSRTRGGAE